MPKGLDCRPHFPKMPPMIPVALFLAVCFLAYSNGANDNFKGVATLFGSKTASYKTALALATTTTLSGSICSIFLAQGLLQKFSGKGLVPETLIGSEVFVLAVALGAGGTVILATLLGFPISTTHGLTGAMLGSGLIAASSQVDFSTLGNGFLLPLLLSPVLAVALGCLFYLALRFFRLKFGVAKELCICAGETSEVVAIPQPSSVMAFQCLPKLSVLIDSESKCTERYAGKFLGVNCQTLMDSAHFLSAGIVSFARGLNDTPKIAALLLLLTAFKIEWGMIAIAVGMAAGGLLNARKVAQTMSQKITRLNAGQGFSANVTTGCLVLLASKYGLPVSTTQVSVGSLFGIGLINRTADLKVVRGIVLSWVLTLPCAALLSAVV